MATELLLQGLISESRLDKGVGICSSMSASKRSLVFKSILNLNTLKIDRLKYVASYMKYVVAYMLCHKYIYQLNDLRYFLSVASCQTPISHLVTVVMYCQIRAKIHTSALSTRGVHAVVGALAGSTHVCSDVIGY